jgi:apolipoprotein N-acyltransferase
VVGQYGLGYLTLLMAGALAAIVLGQRRERIAAGALIAGIWAAAFLLRDVEWTQPSGRPITVAVVQGAVPQDEKWIAGNLDSILELYRTRTREAHGADLIVWPESAIPDLINYHVNYVRDVYAEASATGSSLVMGAMHAEDTGTTGEDRVYNSVLAMDPATPAWAGTTSITWCRSRSSSRCRLHRSWLRLRVCRTRLRSRRSAAGAARGGGARIAASFVTKTPTAARCCPRCRPPRCCSMSPTIRGSAIHRALPAPADQPAARHGRPAPDGACRQRRRVRRHRTSRRILVSAPEYEANVMRGSLQPRIGLTPYARTGNWPVVCLVLVFGLAAAWLGRRGKSARGSEP